MTTPKRSLALLYTTFPKASEEFLRREALELLKRSDVEVAFFSILGGGEVFEGVKVTRLKVWEVLWAIAQGLGLLFLRPRIWRFLAPPRTGGWSNWGENALGVAAGIVWAGRLGKYDALHAQWGSAPAMAALVAKELGGIKQYTMGLHAYDLFERGGDGYLEEKSAASAGIISSNACAWEEVRRRFPSANSVMIRRCLEMYPMVPKGKRVGRCELISVGRLIEKKGFEELLDIAAALKAEGFPFRLRIVGEGALRGALEKKIKRLRLEECVELVGWKTPAQVRELLGNSDIYCFSGKVAASGDRDGFPNVIAEAFMAGVAVIAHKVADVGSGVGSGKTGVLLESLEQGLWVAAIKELLSDEETRAEYVHNARSWVEENFSARKNSERFLKFVFGGKL